MFDFSPLPSRSISHSLLTLLVGGITIGASVGLQSGLLRGQAAIVLLPLNQAHTSELGSQDNGLSNADSPDIGRLAVGPLAQSSDNEPAVDGWPSLLNPPSSTSVDSDSEVVDGMSIDDLEMEEGATEAMSGSEGLPEPLARMVRRIDRAASNENMNGVMRFYSDDLQHSDGITAKDFEAMLTDFWETYDNLNYATEVTDWQETDTGFITTTVTTVTGQTNYNALPLSFESTVESRQVIRDRQIIEQDILAESSQIHFGQMPPTLNVNLPSTVRPGETFYFDVIVLEPIGESLLMGTAFSEPVSLETFRTVPLLDMNGLGAGGLFKVGDAPLAPGQEWVTGLVVREDGITGVTQRLRIVGDR